MLVSSIGYFSVNKTVISNDVIKDKTVNRVSLAEGFGYSNEKTQQNNNSNFLKSFIESFKSLFMKKNNESKCLSLIA